MKFKPIRNLKQFIKEFEKVTYPQLWNELEETFTVVYLNEKGEVNNAAQNALLLCNMAAKGTSVDNISKMLVNDKNFRGEYADATLRLVLHYSPKGLDIYKGFIKTANLKDSQTMVDLLDKYAERNLKFNNELVNNKYKF